MMCKTCESQIDGEYIDYCEVCMAVLPDIVEIPNGRSIRSVEEGVSKFRADLGNPDDRLRHIWEAVRGLPERHDIKWLFSDVQNSLSSTMTHPLSLYVVPYLHIHLTAVHRFI